MSHDLSGLLFFFMLIWVSKIVLLLLLLSIQKTVMIPNIFVETTMVFLFPSSFQEPLLSRKVIRTEFTLNRNLL